MSNPIDLEDLTDGTWEMVPTEPYEVPEFLSSRRLKLARREYELREHCHRMENNGGVDEWAARDLSDSLMAIRRAIAEIDEVVGMLAIAHWSKQPIILRKKQ